MELKVGMHAPDFTLPLATFGSISLSNMRGKPVVLYFYPKDDTPGCTTEACSFRDHLPRFGDFDAAIIGISKDSVESHAAFAKKYGINFHLASDEHSNTAESYGVWVQKNNYGTKYMGIERTTFLIDRHGNIRAIWRRVKVEGHAEEVMQAVEALHMGLPLPGDPPPAPEPAPLPPKPAKAAKPEPKKPEAKKAEPKKVEPKKAEPKKAEAKKAATKKPAKPVAKKPAKPVKKAAAKPAAKKPVAKKTVKPTAKKVAAKKPVKPVKKAAPKKPQAKKPATKKKR